MATDTQQPAEYRLMDRLLSYPAVCTGYNTAVCLYNTAKQRSRVLNYGIDMVKQRGKMLNESKIYANVCTMSTPYLMKADAMACQQLDKLEARMVSGRRSMQENVMQPLCSTYQNIKDFPTMMTDKAEEWMDYYLPEDKGKDEGPQEGKQRKEASLRRVVGLGLEASRRARNRMPMYKERIEAFLRSMLSMLMVLYEYGRILATDPVKRGLIYENFKRVSSTRMDEYRRLANERMEKMRPIFVEKARSVAQPYLVRPIMQAVALYRYIISWALANIQKGPFAANLGQQRLAKKTQ